jgi:hypothetical protein
LRSFGIPEPGEDSFPRALLLRLRSLAAGLGGDLWPLLDLPAFLLLLFLAVVILDPALLTDDFIKDCRALAVAYNSK